MNKLPEYVEVCPVCKGEGEYIQYYSAGCGGGSYESVGPCDYCKTPGSYKGLGFRMKASVSMPDSVINQLKVAGFIKE